MKKHFIIVLLVFIYIFCPSYTLSAINDTKYIYDMVKIQINDNNNVKIKIINSYGSALKFSYFSGSYTYSLSGVEELSCDGSGSIVVELPEGDYQIVASSEQY